MTVRLVDLDDDNHVLEGVVVKRAKGVVTVKRIVSAARPFKTEESWTLNFDAVTGLPKGDRAAFKIHPEDLDP